MKIAVYNSAGEEAGTMELPDRIFGVRWNADLVHQVVAGYAANRRVGSAQAKTRGEVRGGGKKPWRQKGTGRARHGSIRSPIWKGGGVAHGPRTDKVYGRKINKKMAKKALWTVLSAKARDGEVVVVEDMVFPEAKTRHAAAFLKPFLQEGKFPRMKTGRGVLIATGRDNGAIRRAMRNLPYTGMDEARNLNAYEVLQFKYLMFPKSALDTFGSESKITDRQREVETQGRNS
ncbi:MAG: 50S ribosomal protein L4 [Candidatus Sungbacteria bacterium]|uniref:Large ribosomal subunit protein uL4 n=1 Tax=Candidatus Sungiibacteriota bacterium TaxID=2750080 RepID=A0A932QYZ7_9BACT|nr:50S ribosomal protein L4 [Candidatus Sungbacteria bacterium]